MMHLQVILQRLAAIARDLDEPEHLPAEALEQIASDLDDLSGTLAGTAAFVRVLVKIKRR
ncbi:MAG: hypothetical protein DMD33_18775 [Gemmatimonadetes bacterium]|nr:MAG: hypothetical protein DMD33_18775 [Gemmatimonadota bacterium]